MLFLLLEVAAVLVLTALVVFSSLGANCFTRLDNGRTTGSSKVAERVARPKNPNFCPTKYREKNIGEF
jgi:hypothetical protein